MVCDWVPPIVLFLFRVNRFTGFLNSEIAVFLKQNGRAQSVWIRMMRHGEEYLKSSLKVPDRDECYSASVLRRGAAPRGLDQARAMKITELPHPSKRSFRVPSDPWSPDPVRLPSGRCACSCWPPCLRGVVRRDCQTHLRHMPAKIFQPPAYLRRLISRKIKTIRGRDFHLFR